MWFFGVWLLKKLILDQTQDAFTKSKQNPHLQQPNFPQNKSSLVLSVNLSNTHLKLKLGTTKSNLIWLWIRDPKLRASYNWRWWWNSGGCGGGVHADHDDGHVKHITTCHRTTFCWLWYRFELCRGQIVGWVWRWRSRLVLWVHGYGGAFGRSWWCGQGSQVRFHGLQMVRPWVSGGSQMVWPWVSGAFGMGHTGFTVVEVLWVFFLPPVGFDLVAEIHLLGFRQGGSATYVNKRDFEWIFACLFLWKCNKKKKKILIILIFWATFMFFPEEHEEHITLFFRK